MNGNTPHTEPYPKLPAGKKDVWNFIIKGGNLVSGIGLYTLFTTLILCYIALIYGLFNVPHYLLGTSSGPLLYLIVPLPGIVWGIYMGSGGMEVLVFYLGLVVILFLALGVQLKREGRSFLSLVKMFKVRKSAPPADTNNSLLMVLQLFLALLFVNIVTSYLASIMGTPPTVPDELARSGNMARQLYLLSKASVYEELVTRILLIGLPLLALSRIFQNDGKQTQNPKLPWHRYFLGGNITFSTRAYIMIFLSSVLFGLAHQGGWGSWKIWPTMISGFGFGYLFLKKGIFPAILLHFLFDYLDMTRRVLTTLTGLSTIVDLTFAIFILTWIVVGIRYFSHYLLRLTCALANKYRKWKKISGKIYFDKTYEAIISLVILFAFILFTLVELWKFVIPSAGLGMGL